MAKYIEILKTGLTVARKVQVAGARVQVSDDFPIQSKKEQVARWGIPRYREITEEDFIDSGGVVKGAIPAGMFITPAEVAAAQEPAEVPAEALVDELFAPLVGLNVDETLQAVATFDDEQMAKFILWEQSNQARVGVLRALEIESGDDAE